MEQITRRLEQQKDQLGKGWSELSDLKNLKKIRAGLRRGTSLNDAQVHSLLTVSQLQKLSDCDLAWAYLLSQAGVDTIKELANRRAKNLHQRLLHEAQQEGVSADELVNLEVVSNWVAQADS